MSSRRTQQLLSAAVKGVKLRIDIEETLGLDLSTVDIIPKELAVTFVCCFNPNTHLNFVHAFLRRVAELGDFVKL